MKTIAIQTFVDDITPGIVAVAEYDDRMVDEARLLSTLKAACRDVLRRRKARGWEPPYPWCWGDVFETLWEERDDRALCERHGFRVVGLSTPRLVVRHDEPVLFEDDL